MIYPIFSFQIMLIHLSFPTMLVLHSSAVKPWVVLVYMCITLSIQFTHCRFVSSIPEREMGEEMTRCIHQETGKDGDRRHNHNSAETSSPSWPTRMREPAIVKCSQHHQPPNVSIGRTCLSCGHEIKLIKVQGVLVPT